MNKEFIYAFKEVVREQLVNKNKVELEGLGAFVVEHREQHQKKYDNGRIVVMPPSDVVVFKSNVRFTDEDR